MSQLDLFESDYSTVDVCAEGEIDPAELEKIYELSIDAYFSALNAAMSELPLKNEINRFIKKVVKTKTREEADRAASDRGDPNVLAVLRAAGKVSHEIHRICGFLRFNPLTDGTYVAKCAPDHFILPALTDHFTLRFGETAWAIIDEKRGLCLLREKGREASLGPIPQEFLAKTGENSENQRSSDPWEDLWKLYHNSVNNEGRKNLQLQRQFVPVRYRKYLNEFDVN